MAVIPEERSQEVMSNLFWVEQTRPDDFDARVPHYIHRFHNAREGVAARGCVEVILDFGGSHNLVIEPTMQSNGKTLRLPDGSFACRIAPGESRTFAMVRPDDPRNDCEICASARARLASGANDACVRFRDVRVVVGCAPSGGDVAPIREARRRLLGWVQDGAHGAPPLTLRETRDLKDDLWLASLLERAAPTSTAAAH